MANATPYLLLLWLPIAVLIFASFKPHRGALVCILVGMCYLPVVGGAMASKEVTLTPLHFTKENTISYAVFLAVLIADSKALLAFRPRWFDIPMLVWCVCPFFSSLVNAPPPDGSSPARDGISQCLAEVVTWGICYLLGRIYFQNPPAFRDLALGIVFVAVAYVPLCLFEVRFSPQLHQLFYGYLPHQFLQTVRFGGYRPMVFFRHGLVLSMFMITATLMAVGLYATTKKRLPWFQQCWGSNQLGLMVAILIPMAVLARSTGALVLGVCGGCVLFLARLWPTRLWLLPLAIVPPLYVATRVSRTWSGETAVKMVTEYLGGERAESLQYRLNAESMLMEKAEEKKWLGWAGWGRARIYDQEGNDVVGTDGLWIITYGNRGFVGLAALGALFLIPAVRFALIFPPRTWCETAAAPAFLSVILGQLYSIDFLFNGNFDHIVPLLLGAAAGADPKMLLSYGSPGVVAPRAVKRPAGMPLFQHAPQNQ